MTEEEKQKSVTREQIIKELVTYMKTGVVIAGGVLIKLLGTRMASPDTIAFVNTLLYGR